MTESARLLHDLTTKIRYLLEFLPRQGTDDDGQTIAEVLEETDLCAGQKAGDLPRRLCRRRMS